MTTPQAVRYLNEIRALNVLFRDGGMSRAELARALGLTRSTTGSLVSHLLADGFVVERAAAGRGAEGRSGRPGIVVAIRPEAAVFLAAEIGVGYIAVLALDLAAEVVTRSRAEFDQRLPPQAVAARVAAMVREVVARCGARERIRGLCVTVPAFHDNRGVVLTAPFLGWRDVPIADLIRAELGEDLPVVSENDANAFAIGEIYAGGAGGDGDLLCILVETGVGAGILSNGKLFRGARGFAGEVGHMVVGERGVIHRLDPPGRWENYIGGEAVLIRHREEGGVAPDMQSFLAELDGGSVAARRTAEHWAYWLGRGLASLANLLNPSTVVLGGSVSPIFPRVRARVEEVLRNHVFVDYPVPEIRMSRLGTDGVAVGAACLLHQEMLSLDGRLLSRESWRPVGGLTAGESGGPSDEAGRPIGP